MIDSDKAAKLRQILGMFRSIAKRASTLATGLPSEYLDFGIYVMDARKHGAFSAPNLYELHTKLPYWYSYDNDAWNGRLNVFMKVVSWFKDHREDLNLSEPPGHEHGDLEWACNAVASIIESGLFEEMELSPEAAENHNGGRRDGVDISHSPDFTSVNWLGTRYSFAKGNQAETVRVLWEAWESGGHSLSQESIGAKIDSRANRFELRKVFRKKTRGKSKGYETHPAWGTMIQQEGQGCYRLGP